MGFFRKFFPEYSLFTSGETYLQAPKCKNFFSILEIKIYIFVKITFCQDVKLEKNQFFFHANYDIIQWGAKKTGQRGNFTFLI